MLQTLKREGVRSSTSKRCVRAISKGRYNTWVGNIDWVVRGRPSSVEIGSVVGPRNGKVREDLIRSSDRGQDHLTILRTP